MTNQTLQSHVNSDDMKNIIQQRQILSMMGLDVWVQRDTPTVKIDFDSMESLASLDVSNSDNPNCDINHISDIGKADESDNLPSVSETTQAHFEHVPPQSESVVQPVTSTQEVASFDNLAEENSVVEKASVKSQIGEIKSKLSSNTSKSSTKNSTDTLLDEKIPQIKPRTHYEQVMPFELHGARFGEWVLMADGQSLKNEQTLMLWNNLLSALSLIAEQLKFPICEGISDKESANASVAGFIFRLSKRDNAKLAVVTPLPEGIDHDRVIRVPYLEEMLQDSRQKKQLWQLLTEDS